jgi:putative transposase
MLEHRYEFWVATMCRVLKVARAGYYQWIHKPLSDRAIDDQRLLGIIQSSYAASGGVYGSRRVFLDLRETGETCGVHRVARIMRINQIKALRGYKAPRSIAGRPSIIAPNTLQREFTVELPNRAWVTDITYSAPSPWRRPGRRCQGLSMSGMHSDFHKDEGRGMPAICYEVARAEAAVTCRTLAG